MPGKKVTKADLIEAVYQNEDVSKDMIRTITDELLLKIKESIMEGSTIELRGFGTFELRLRKGRAQARNPKTGEKLSVEPHYVAAFRAGQELKTALWKLDTK